MLYHLNAATATSPSTISDLLTEDLPTSRTIIAALLIDPDVCDRRLAAAHSTLVDTPIPVLVNTSTTTFHNVPADTAGASRSWVVSALVRLGAAVLGIGEPLAPLMEEAALLAAFATMNGSMEMRLSRALQERRKEAELSEVKRCQVSGCDTCAVIMQRGCRDK